jgi:RNA polymerase sigma-B factor
VQVASAALVAAARRYDAGRGVPFASYAGPTIDGELRRHLRDRTATIRIPRAEQTPAAVLRGGPRRATPLPLDELEQRASPDAEEALEDCERRTLVAELLAVLTPREREAVRLRFEEDLQQTAIARRLGVSQSSASRVLASALTKLRRTAA